MQVVQYRNNRIKNIVNVYQLNYTNGIVCQGLGDFINGCFFLLQLCIKFNLNFSIDISNHPISKYFILNDKSKKVPISYENVSFYKIPDSIRSNKLQCYNNFVSHLNTISDETYSLFCNFDPTYNVQDRGREIIKSYLTPSIEIENEISSILTDFKLQPYQFEVIHIRTGDKFLLNKNRILSEHEKNQYMNFLLQNTNNSTNYVIISDNMQLKNALNKDNFYSSNIEICHTGENGYKPEDGLKNTVLDFFMMSKSTKITSISLSSRGGTGFSRMCATMFNIPYTSLLIDLGDHLT